MEGRLLEELQVPTRRIVVDLFTDHGQFTGSLFVTESRFHLGLLDELIKILNDERTFLPFTPDGKEHCSIISKDHVLRLRLHGGPEEQLDPENIDSETSRLTLSDGTWLEGEVAVTTPASLSRLVDKVNQAPRFMTVVTPEDVEFVRTSHVVRID